MVKSIVTFSVHAGQATPFEPFIRTWTNLDKALGKIYAVVEVLSGPPIDVADVVLDAVESSFKDNLQLSITYYLKEAIKKSHENLRAYSARDWRASLTLVSVQNDGFYLANAGPAFANLYTSGSVYDVITPSQSTLGKGVSLGEDGEFITHLAYKELKEDDILLLAWGTLGAHLNDGGVRSLFQGDADHVSRNVYRLVNDEKEFAVLVISCEK
jgi:hypothetical protein